MFGRKKKEREARSVSVFSDLQLNDLIVFKPRDVLPNGISDETLTVEKIGAYDFDEDLSADFTLRHASGQRFSAAYDSDENTITFGRKLKRSEVLGIFDEDDFANVFDGGLSQVNLQASVENVPEDLQLWIDESYQRTVADGIAYYYESDRREQGVSAYKDGSQQFTYFELEGGNDRNSLSIEIWSDGETDVYCEVTVKANVVDTYLCHD
ncbi:MAG: hypothetical protein ACJAYF_001885 [Arenicella sp.]|jgi:hypothetical protein